VIDAILKDLSHAGHALVELDQAASNAKDDLGRALVGAGKEYLCGLLAVGQQVIERQGRTEQRLPFFRATDTSP
jgi:hypothetical protein